MQYGSNIKIMNNNYNSKNNNDKIINDNDNDSSNITSLILENNVFSHHVSTYLNYCFFSLNLAICSNLRDQHMRDFSAPC